MPPELTFNRPEYGWASSTEHHAAQREWLRGHGIDPADWQVVHPIMCASRRAHARTSRELSALDRMWVSRDPASAVAWWPPLDGA